MFGDVGVYERVTLEVSLFGGGGKGGGRGVKMVVAVWSGHYFRGKKRSIYDKVLPKKPPVIAFKR